MFRYATLCETCGLLPGLHRPDGSCPLTRRTLHAPAAPILAPWARRAAITRDLPATAHGARAYVGR